MRPLLRVIVACTVLEVGCGSGVSTTKPLLRPESVWAEHLRSSAAAVDGAKYRGKLFTLRAENGSFTNATWIRCPLDVSYRFESFSPKTFRIDIRDLASLIRFFPANYEELRSSIDKGQTIRVRYTVSGRFVMNGSSPRAASIVCPAATHHVQSIVLGAYRVTVGRSMTPGAVTSADVRSDTHGRPSTCKGKSSSPLPGCRVPLAFELAPIPGHDPKRKLRDDDKASLNSIPRIETMPRVLQRRAGTNPRVGFEDCWSDFLPTGDIEPDLDSLTSRCGAPTGMVPHSEVLQGWQAATADVSRYSLRLEAGQCYRAFGVGGQGVRDLDMGWFDPKGKLVSRDVRPDPWAVVPPGRPICAQASGNYELIVSVEGGRGSFALQVWRVQRE